MLFALFIIVKNCFYCVNTSYPMDNSLSGRRGPARQTTEKVILYVDILAGRPWCALARWRIGIASCLDSVTSWHLFRLARGVFTRNFCSHIFLISLPGCLFFHFNILFFKLWRVYRLILCLHLVKKGGVVAMQWRPLMDMLSAHVAGIKRRERIHALRTQRVSVIFVPSSPLNNCYNFRRPLID